MTTDYLTLAHAALKNKRGGESYEINELNEISVPNGWDTDKAESPRDRQAGLHPEGYILPDNLLDELINWPEQPSESELQSRGSKILRNHATARTRIEIANAADAWDRMCAKFKNRGK